MTGESIVIRGTVREDGTLQVTDKVSLPPGPVEVVVRRVEGPPQGEGLLEVLARIRADQAARGHVPRSAEEVDASIRQMRDEWEERDDEIEAIHEESRRARETPPPPGESS
jgi:hypothetical protein